MERNFDYFAKRFPSFFGPQSPERQEKERQRRVRTAIWLAVLFLVPLVGILVYSATPFGKRAQLEAELQRIEQHERQIAADRVKRAADQAARTVQAGALSMGDEKTKQLLSEVDRLATESELRLRAAEDELMRNGRARRAEILLELRALGAGGSWQ